MENVSNTVLLKAEEISIGYRHGKKVVKEVHSRLSFELRSGELTCLLGANGAGKSTLLRTLSASQPVLEGQLLLKGKRLEDYSEKELSRLIGVVLTDKTQVGGLTVFELVALGRQPHTGFFGRLNRRDKQLIDEAIQQVGIQHKVDSYVAELSDGERQKVMIAKALVQECPLIILDEPTAFLDIVSRIEIMTLLHRLAVEQQKAILLSTHDMEQALVLADRLWLLSDKNGLQTGITEDLILLNHMDDLFQHSDIHFDLAHGVYYPSVRSERKIYLQATDEILRHWTINALNRQGYSCLLKEEGYPLLYAESPQRLILKTSETESVVYTSFDALLSALS